jgi:predicted RNA-binding Zn ribbon-like protein
MTSPHTFTLSGGHPVLDFVNTVDDWMLEAPQDYLTTFDDAVRLATAAGLLSRAESSRLGHSAGGAAELARLRSLRGSLEGILRSLLAGRPPDATDLARLQLEQVEVARATEIRLSRTGVLSREIPMSDGRSSTLRLRIVDAALALLSSDVIRRVKACPTCGWFFLDVSKNQSRVWCSMDTCGARAKARRYYHRTRRAIHRPASRGTRHGER